MSEWTLIIAAPLPWISANDRTHHNVRAHQVHEWRHATLALARYHRLPKALPAAHIVATVHHTAARYDAANLAPTAKACVDGLVDYGLVADDDNTHVTGPDMRPGPRYKKRVYGPVGELVLTIKEIA